MRAETCSEVTCVTYTHEEVVAKKAIIVVFINVILLTSLRNIEFTYDATVFVVRSLFCVKGRLYLR
jgi:hypothetical protein